MSVRRNPQPKSQRRQQKVSNQSLLTASSPYSPGTPASSMKIQGVIGKYTTIVTSGLIARTTAIEAGLISNFSTRFQAFDEYRIIKAVFEAYPCSSNNPGQINMWVEPLNSSTPTSASASTNNVVSFSAGGNNKVTKLIYKPLDFAYLDWTPVATSTGAVGYFNVYSDNANFASSIVATDYLVVRVWLTLQFRGFA